MGKKKDNREGEYMKDSFTKPIIKENSLDTAGP